MAKYLVQAIDASGKERRDLFEANSQAEAMSLAEGKKLTVLEIEEAKGGATLTPPSFQWKKAVSQGAVLSFYEQLGFLIKAGIPVFQAIKMLSDTLRDAALQKILKEVQFELSEGFPLSLALQKYAASFPPLHTSLIAVGEKSGNLDAALNQLVELVREHRDIRERLIKAAAYPVFLLSLSVGLVVGLLLYIFPKFEDIFKSFNVKLPATTEFLLTLSQALREHGFFSLTLTLGTITLLGYFLRRPSLSYERAKFFFNTPIVSQVLIFQFTALFSKTLSGLLASGVPLMESLGICKETLHGKFKGMLFEKLLRTVKEGEPMSKGMEGELLIPEMARQLVIVGEKTGRIDVMTDNIFRFYKKEYVERLGVMTSILQPLLLFLAAGLIATVAISLFVPLFKLGAAMKSGE